MGFKEDFEASQKSSFLKDFEATQTSPSVTVGQNSDAEQMAKAGKVTIGAVEALAGGAADLANQAISGVTALGKAALAKKAGLNFMDTFNEEFSHTYQGVQKAIPYQPVTPEGQAILGKVSEIVGKALQFAGDTTFNLANRVGAPSEVSSAIGAGTQALAMLAALRLGGKELVKPKSEGAPKVGTLKDAEAGIYENWKDPKYVAQWAEKNYPETVKNLQASNVGKVIANEYKSVDVYDKVHEALNEELGLKDGGGLSLTQKFMQMMDNFDPNQTVPVEAKTKITDSVLGQLDALNRIANADKTPEQLMENRIIRPNQTPLDIINRMIKPELPEADLKTRAEDFKTALNEHQGYVINPTTGIERPLTAGEYLDMQQRARDQQPVTPQDIVKSRTVEPSQGLSDIIDQMVGLKKDKPASPADIKAAINEPSGVYVIDPNQGQVERQLTVGEYYDMVQAGKDIKAKPVNKQSGMLLNDAEEALKNNNEALKKLAEKTPTITTAGMLTDKRYQEINRVMDAGAEDRTPVRILKEETQKRLLDTSGPMKAKLEDIGKLGNQAKMRFNLIKGAPGAAQLKYNEYAKEVYQGLSHSEVNALDRLVRARRIVAIDQYKGIGKIKHMANTNGAEMEAFKNNLKGEIGNESYAKVDAAASKYFRAQRGELDALHDNGLLTDESYLKMVNFEYTPTEALEYLDPKTSFTFHGKTITVRDSGIQDLGKGQFDPVRMNSKDLLADNILRARTRIMRNEANKAMFRVGEAQEAAGLESPLVKIGQVKEWDGRGKAIGVEDAPAGYTRIDAVVDGRQRPMFFRNDMAEEWVTKPHAQMAEFANFLNLVSGTAVVKTLATTVNPAFALVNIPRDMMHIWQATDQYSTWAPVAALQLGVDVATVAKDAIARTGRFDDFIREGGSQELLSQQGPAHFLGSQVHAMTSSWRNVYEALSYVGATSETLTRLALRERAIKNGMDPWEASAVAREYLDFSDGGSWVKGADTMFPYLNAATQAMYTVGKQASRDPKRYALQQAQILAASVGMTLALVESNNEAWKQIPQQTKGRSYIIAPKDMFVIDPQGNKRYVYFTLALDQTVTPVHTLGTALVDRAVNGKVPDGTTMQVLKNLNPLSTGLMTPAATAITTYVTNYDFWRDSAIWKGAKVKPEDEIIDASRPDATPEFWQQVGQLTGMSPVRLRAAIGAIAPANPYTDIQGASYQYVMAGASDADKAKMTWQMIAENPVLRRVVHMTHPFTAEIDALDAAERDRNSARGKQSSAINEMVFKINTSGLSPTAQREQLKSFAKAWLPTQNPEDQDRLSKDLVATYAIDSTFRKLKASDGIPSQIWWRATAHADPVVRGEIFYQEWVSRDAAHRAQMLRVAGALGQVGLPYNSDDFQRQFAKERKQWGDEQR